MEQLIRVQRLIGERALRSVAAAPPLPEPRLVAGVDASYSRRYGGVAAAALVDANCRLVEYSVAVGEPRLPYIPGLLAFREAALFYAALSGLSRGLDALLVDGHGISHPRHAGIASHLGLALARPTVGVAKKRLYGVVEASGSGCSRTPCVTAVLRDPESGLLLAYLVKSTPRTRSPIYVSPGAYISHKDALGLVARLISRYKLPCPTRYADKLSRMVARMLDEGRLSPSQLRSRPPPPPPGLL